MRERTERERETERQREREEKGEREGELSMHADGHPRRFESRDETPHLG